jgi:uncharacterized protein (TIGR03089 family)
MFGEVFRGFGVSVLDSGLLTCPDGHDGPVNNLRDFLAAWPNPSRPFVTYYDLATGERVELSGTTARNWVMKAANLLVDEADADVGARVMLTLPTHWMRMVWLLASWAVGGTVVDRDADVGIAGPDLDFGPPPLPRHRWASALKPLGTPFDTLSPEVIDLGRALPGQPDAFFPSEEPSSDDAAVELTDLRTAYGTLTDVASPLADRRAFEPADLRTDIERLIGACRGGGSLVLVTNATPQQIRDVAAQEQALPG